jgi:hypothetical protein
MPTIFVGHDYILLISHFTNSQSGYQLSFTMGQPGGGTAAITDPANPIPKLISATGNCDGSQITIHFNKRLKCSSLTSNGNEFTLSPGGTIITAAGIGCTSGFDLDSVILYTSAPLAPGIYTVITIMELTAILCLMIAIVQSM